MFKIAFTKLVQWLIPTWLRSNTLVLLVLAANKPLREVYDSFDTYRDAVMYKLANNGQVVYLQKVLNDSFDFVARRIKVVDFKVYGKEYLYDVTNVPKIRYATNAPSFFLYGSDTGLDFTVQVPSTLINSPAKIAALKAKVNEYKMDGKNFYIQSI
jgi:hypothetical protein